MTEKERKKVFELLDQVRAIVAMDERKQSTKGAPAYKSAEHMAELRRIRAEKNAEARKAKLWEKLQKLESQHPSSTNGTGRQP